VTKAEQFRALHYRDRAFLIPNPWDPGTARLLAGLRFEALATTSAGFAFSQGLRDGAVGREAMLAHCAAMVSATDLPVSADLENGFGDSPEEAAETIRLAAATGLAGGSIEDFSGSGIYEKALAVERVRAAVEAADGKFVLTARCENYLHGRADLPDTIARLHAYAAAGADVVFAPGLTTREEISAVVQAVDCPVNVLAVRAGDKLTLADLSALGVKRVSVGSGLARAALGSFLRAAQEMKNHGTFEFADEAISYRDISSMFPG
jgi:2-methylisocitrate lyase-like PEP mutase family enzyme